MYLPKGATDIQQDLQKPVGMALRAGTSGGCVQPVHMRPGILSTRKVTISTLYVFLKKSWWIFLKHHLHHTILMGKATHPSLFQKQEWPIQNLT